VPILLGTIILASALPDAGRIYLIIFIVVAFSVIVQGGLVPSVARWCRVPMRVVEQEPWSLGVRLREEPQDLHRFVVAVDAPATGHTIDEVHLDVGMLLRDGQLVSFRGDTEIRAGDEVIVLSDPDHAASLLTG
jgi:cell volume regulation protein A